MKSLIGRVAVFTAVALLAVALGAGAEPGASAGKARAKLSTARGEVKSVSESTLSVGTGKARGVEMVLALDSQTIVLKKGKRIGTKELRPGDRVTVSYDQRGAQAVAKRVWVRTASPKAGASGKSKTIRKP